MLSSGLVHSRFWWGKGITQSSTGNMIKSKIPTLRKVMVQLENSNVLILKKCKENSLMTIDFYMRVKNIKLIFLKNSSLKKNERKPTYRIHLKDRFQHCQP